MIGLSASFDKRKHIALDKYFDYKKINLATPPVQFLNVISNIAVKGG